RMMRFARSGRLWNRWNQPSELLQEPEGRRILVLAPHMDDEVIGCGGTVRKCVLSGKEVAVAYMTDGRFGDDDLAAASGSEREEIQRRLIRVRREEAHRACQILGIGHISFLDAEDANLRLTPEIREKLLDVLSSVRPDAVLCPFFTDDHPDHRETTRILLEVTEDTGFSFDCYCYEVWSPLYPNCLVDITGVMDCKRRALEAYPSQLKGINYPRVMEALNVYRSMRVSRGGYAEAFWRSPLAHLRDFHERVNGWEARPSPDAERRRRTRRP
ncbi:MAG: PIG-L deacetylase family protein, partial [Candidatus Deferrimicrobium sp.]